MTQFSTYLRERFTPRFRRLVPRLFEQQMWCWGQDVRYPAQNLLMAYGFTRQRSIGDPQLSTCYSHLALPEAHITLWGYGLFFGRRTLGGLFVSRNGFALTLIPHATLTTDQWMAPPDGEPPATRAQCEVTGKLLLDAIAWMADYERWIVEHVSVTHRAACLTAWKRKPVVPAAEMASTWDALTMEA